MKVPGIPFIQGRNWSPDVDGKKYAIAIHNTSNNASDEDEAHYATTRTDSVSSHFYVDDDSVIQSLDTAVKAWHAGSSEGNDNAIAVEIRGLNGWSRQQWLLNVAWDKLGSALAKVCIYHGIPVTRPTVSAMRDNPHVRGFYSHDYMRQAWGGTTHTDPGPNFPWDKLFTVVNAAIAKETGMTTDQKIHALFTALFFGGSSCGDTVPAEYRVSADGNGNAIVDKLNYLTALLEKQTAA